MDMSPRRVCTNPRSVPHPPSPQRHGAITPADDGTPEGLSIAARLRSALADGQPISDLLEAWLPHAGEDSALDRKLALELLECSALVPNEEHFIDRDAARMTNAQKDTTARDLNRRAGVCDGIDDETRKQYQFDLITAAANAGDVDAQTSYLFFAGPYVRSDRSMVRDGIRETFKHDAVRFAQAALATHSRAAYGNAYAIQSSDLYGAHDPVAAYAYLLKTTEGLNPALTSRLESAAGAGMTADQLDQARRLASRLPMTPDPDPLP